MAKGKSKKKDDLKAVATVVKALQTFDDEIRERIIRWAREKLDDLEAAGKKKRSKKAKKKSAKKKKKATRKKSKR